MRIQMGQHLLQKQVQILAPKMIHSMEILQLPIVELQERIEQELQENPLLDIREGDTVGGNEPGEGSPEASAVPDDPTAWNEGPAAALGEPTELSPKEKQREEEFDRLLNMNEEWDSHFDSAGRASSNRVEEEGDRKHDAMANAVSRPETLQEHLCDQLAWFDLTPPQRAMCERIIYNLDAAGYLPCELKDILDPQHGPEDLAAAEAALKVVQKLDPAGAGARSLEECLLLQLKPGMPYYEELHVLISQHMKDLSENRLPLIQKKTGFTLATIQGALEELRHLKPRPGSDFEFEPAPPITPDIYVEPAEGGGYRVRLDDTQMPALFISPYYRKMLTTGQASGETKDYIKNKITSAQWLIESIEQRRNTLQKVSQAIVDHQRAFFDLGPESIEPLKMQQIADRVGVHVTTVSRAVDGKWIQTPRGLFPLKRFFVGGTQTADGDDVAWDAIRIKLQEIVDGEDKSKPLSDEDLMEEMAKHGLTVARRTITKYRKAMKIPSSRQRRVWTDGAPPPDADDGDD